MHRLTSSTTHPIFTAYPKHPQCHLTAGKGSKIALFDFCLLRQGRFHDMLKDLLAPYFNRRFAPYPGFLCSIFVHLPKDLVIR